MSRKASRARANEGPRSGDGEAEVQHPPDSCFFDLTCPWLGLLSCGEVARGAKRRADEIEGRQTGGKERCLGDWEAASLRKLEDAAADKSTDKGTANHQRGCCTFQGSGTSVRPCSFQPEGPLHLPREQMLSLFLRSTWTRSGPKLIDGPYVGRISLVVWVLHSNSSAMMRDINRWGHESRRVG